MTDELEKFPEMVYLVDFVVLEPEVDEQVLLKDVRARREKLPPKGDLEPHNCVTKGSCSPP